MNTLYILSLVNNVFLRDLYEGHLSLKDADDKQSNFAAKLKDLDKEFFKKLLF